MTCPRYHRKSGRTGTEPRRWESYSCSLPTKFTLVWHEDIFGCQASFMAVQGQSPVEKRLLNLSSTVILDTLDASVLQRATHECCVEHSVTLNTLEDLLVLAKADA